MGKWLEKALGDWGDLSSWRLGIQLVHTHTCHPSSPAVFPRSWTTEPRLPLANGLLAGILVLRCKHYFELDFKRITSNIKPNEF